MQAKEHRLQVTEYTCYANPDHVMQLTTVRANDSGRTHLDNRLLMASVKLTRSLNKAGTALSEHNQVRPTESYNMYDM